MSEEKEVVPPTTNQTEETQEQVIETVVTPEESKEITEVLNQEPVMGEEVVITTSTIELKDEPVKEFESKPVLHGPLEQTPDRVTPITIPELRPEFDKTLPFEERILAFLNSRKMEGFIKLNDFLKSLYPIPKFNEPPVYLQQAESKKMRVLLGTMQATGKIEIRNNGHLKLGTLYTPESKDGNAVPNKYHDLVTTIIEARMR